jgi:hypothetical protein
VEAWIGPALLAAVIAGLVNVAGWFVTFQSTRRLDQARRREKIRDFQIALRAEIRSELRNLGSYDVQQQLSRIRGLYETRPDYTVTVPQPAASVVFSALVGEIQILPARVIDPVILFERQRAAIRQLAEEIREARFASLAREQQLAMYEDYLHMWSAWRDFAVQAEGALDISLNSPVADRSDR